MIAFILNSMPRWNLMIYLGLSLNYLDNQFTGPFLLPPFRFECRIISLVIDFSPRFYSMRTQKGWHTWNSLLHRHSNSNSNSNSKYFIHINTISYLTSRGDWNPDGFICPHNWVNTYNNIPTSVLSWTGVSSWCKGDSVPPNLFILQNIHVT